VLHDGGQPGRRRRQRRLLGAMPFQETVLHDVLGFRLAADDAAADRGQARAQLLEQGAVGVGGAWHRRSPLLVLVLFDAWRGPDVTGQ
jgi:hypothetical protein